MEDGLTQRIVSKKSSEILIFAFDRYKPPPVNGFINRRRSQFVCMYWKHIFSDENDFTFSLPSAIFRNESEIFTQQLLSGSSSEIVKLNSSILVCLYPQNYFSSKDASKNSQDIIFDEDCLTQTHACSDDINCFWTRRGCLRPAWLTGRYHQKLCSIPVWLHAPDFRDSENIFYSIFKFPIDHDNDLSYSRKYLLFLEMSQMKFLYSIIPDPCLFLTFKIIEQWENMVNISGACSWSW